MKTIYYSKEFKERLHTNDHIIYLNVGDVARIGDLVYEIIWKLFNTTDNIMIYQCKPV